MDLYAASRSATPDRALFASPGAAYRGTPFWSWNGALERGRLLGQLDQLQAMGMGGAHIHARTGLTTPYLSDEFMGHVRACVDHQRAHGQLTWLYDEDRWPSGFAGGLVTRDPAFRQRCLLFTPRSYAQDPGDRTEGLRVEQGRCGDGPLVGAYALRFADGRLAASRRLAAGEAAGAGETAWWAYLETPPTSSWYNHQTNVDVMNPAAIRRFIEVTHERYRGAVGAEFGKSIPAIFTDEPLFTGKSKAHAADDRRDLYLPWTADLAQTLQAAHGLDIAEHLPWLFFDPPAGQPGPAPGVARIRWSWHDHVAERFRTAFAEQIGGWCGEHGILMTGHLESEGSLGSQTARAGECMRFYQPMQLPGVDMLCDAQELTTVLQTRSVARQEGRPGVASELYGVTNWDFTFAGHKRQGDWQAALGVTVRVHHLAWYTMAGEAKRDYPAPIDAHSPWWREYPLVEDHFARLNTCLTRGAPRARVAVVHPIESLWLAFGQSDAGGAERDSLEAQFRDLAAWLVHGLIDADYVAESLLWRQRTAVGDGACAVGAMAYDTILVPGLATIRSTTLDLLERCADAGVRVLFVGRIPALVDALPSERARRLAARCPQVVPERAALLAVLEDRREVRVRRTDGASCPDGLLHQLRSDGDARWLFVCNSGNQAHGRLAVGLRGRWQAELWDTATGAVAPAAVRSADGWSEVAWDCQGAGHLLVRLLPAAAAPAAAGPAAAPARAAQTGDWELGASAAGEIGRLGEPWAIVRDEPNVLLLDQAVGSLDGGADEPLCEILRQDNAWRERLGWGRITSRIAQPWCDGALPRDHRVRLRWTVRLEAPVAGARLALERADQALLRLDGCVLAARPDGWWVDAAILTVPLPDLAAGSHVIEAELPYGRDTVLEWAYLLGEFGVRVEGRRALVTAAPARVAWGDLGPQGLPFYAGNLTYRVRLDHRGGRLALQAHRFRAPLLRVRLDGREAGAIAWAPWRVDLGEVAAGSHELELTCFGDRRNAFAQVHHAGPERHRWWGPDSWRSQGEDWSDEYVLAPHGVLSAPRLLG
jgi:hypothetical protein